MSELYTAFKLADLTWYVSVFITQLSCAVESRARKSWLQVLKKFRLPVETLSLIPLRWCLSWRVYDKSEMFCRMNWGRLSTQLTASALNLQ